MRVAIYARVSTHDQQTLGMQVEAMSASIQNRDWNVAKSWSRTSAQVPRSVPVESRS
jgi:DNA invertase Pin-like site-specific DNA recombinase